MTTKLQVHVLYSPHPPFLSHDRSLRPSFLTHLFPLVPHPCFLYCLLHCAGEELHVLAQEVVEMMKEVCGKETFSKAYALVHQGVAATRERRRKAQAIQVGLLC